MISANKGLISACVISPKTFISKFWNFIILMHNQSFSFIFAKMRLLASWEEDVRKIRTGGYFFFSHVQSFKKKKKVKRRRMTNWSHVVVNDQHAPCSLSSSLKRNDTSRSAHELGQPALNLIEALGFVLASYSGSARKFFFGERKICKIYIKFWKFKEIFENFGGTICKIYKRNLKKSHEGFLKFWEPCGAAAPQPSIPRSPPRLASAKLGFKI